MEVGKGSGGRDQIKGEPIKGTSFRRGVYHVVARFGIVRRDVFLHRNTVWELVLYTFR